MLSFLDRILSALSALERTRRKFKIGPQKPGTLLSLFLGFLYASVIGVLFAAPIKFGGQLFEDALFPSFLKSYGLAGAAATGWVVGVVLRKRLEHKKKGA